MEEKEVTIPKIHLPLSGIEDRQLREELSAVIPAESREGGPPSIKLGKALSLFNHSRPQLKKKDYSVPTVPTRAKTIRSDHSEAFKAKQDNKRKHDYCQKDEEPTKLPSRERVVSIVCLDLDASTCLDDDLALSLRTSAITIRAWADTFKIEKTGINVVKENGREVVHYLISVPSVLRWLKRTEPETKVKLYVKKK